MGQDRSRRPDVFQDDPSRLIDRTEIRVRDDPGAMDRMRLRVEEPLPEPLSPVPRAGRREDGRGVPQSDPSPPRGRRPGNGRWRGYSGPHGIRSTSGGFWTVIPSQRPSFTLAPDTGWPIRKVAPFAISSSRKRWKIRVPGIDGGSIGISKTRAPVIVSSVFRTAAGFRRPRTAGRPMNRSPAICCRIASPRRSRKEASSIRRASAGAVEPFQAVAGERQGHPPAFQVERHRIALKILEPAEADDQRLGRGHRGAGGHRDGDEIGGAHRPRAGGEKGVSRPRGGRNCRAAGRAPGSRRGRFRSPPCPSGRRGVPGGPQSSASIPSAISVSGGISPRRSIVFPKRVSAPIPRPAIRTFAPISTAVRAAVSPASPVPMTMRSKRFMPHPLPAGRILRGPG